MDKTIYLDNAATTWPKPETVYQAVEQAMREIGANPGRSSHRLSVKAEGVIDETRRRVARVFNAPAPERVIFTLNCTDSLNMAMKGLIRPGSRVITGPFEHNSVNRPLVSLAKSGVKVVRARGTDDFRIDLDNFRDLCKDGIDFAVISHVSNVTGCAIPVVDIAEIVHQAGGILILDAAQSAGILPIDLQKMGIDILAAPGHKGLYGPMGVGVLVIGGEIQIDFFREGGSGILSEGESQPEKYPWRLEGGTPNLPGIAGLRAGLDFIQEIGIENIGRHDSELAKLLIDGLREIPGVHLYCDTKAPDSGVVSFTIDQMDVALTAAILDQNYGIAVRGGLHCAPVTHKNIGTFPEGTVRASFSHFNSAADAEQLVAAVKEMAQG